MRFEMDFMEEEEEEMSEEQSLVAHQVVFCH